MKVNERAKTATESRKISSNSTEEGTMVAVGVGDAVPVVATPTMVNGVVNGNAAEVAVNQEQLKAMEK